MARTRGLYETLMTEALEAELAALGDRLHVSRAELDKVEAADRIALHVSRVLERAVASLDDQRRVALGAALARQLVGRTGLLRPLASVRHCPR